MNWPLVKSVLVSGSVAMAILGAASAYATGEKASTTQMCVPLIKIYQTSAIDDRTILIEMQGRSYKRMDLANRCPGLLMGYGYVHHTRTNDICTTDVLKVNQPAGAICAIKQIVTISAEEAKALKKKAR